MAAAAPSSGGGRPLDRWSALTADRLLKSVITSSSLPGKKVLKSRQMASSLVRRHSNSEASTNWRENVTKYVADFAAEVVDARRPEVVDGATAETEVNVAGVAGITEVTAEVVGMATEVAGGSSEIDVVGAGFAAENETEVSVAGIGATAEPEVNVAAVGATADITEDTADVSEEAADTASDVGDGATSDVGGGE